MFYPEHKKKIFDNISVCCELCSAEKDVAWDDALSMFVCSKCGHKEILKNEYPFNSTTYPNQRRIK
jgi:predicted RNA-binding Zn-ribbon protein involved in translation (DUF1610 family)